MKDDLCNNAIFDENQKGHRCTKVAAYVLFNGSQAQGKACEECARALVSKTKFLRMLPIT